MTSSSARDEAEETQGPPWIFFLEFHFVFSVSFVFPPSRKDLFSPFPPPALLPDDYHQQPFPHLSFPICLCFPYKKAETEESRKGYFSLILADWRTGRLSSVKCEIPGRRILWRDEAASRKGQAVPSCLLSRGRKVSSARQHRNDDSDSRVGGKK